MIAICFELTISTGVGYPIKIPDLHNLHQKRIENSGTGSQVLVNTQVVRLLQEWPEVPGSRVVGAILQCASSIDKASPSYIEVRAKNVVLATGGFQGSPDLTSRHLGPGGDTIFVRSNTGSVGDGLTAASSIGAATSRGMSTFYGHLLAAPLRREEVDPKNFLPLAQYRKFSAQSIISGQLELTKF